MKSARILILDDDPAIGELLGEMISMLGYRPTACECATRALSILGEQRFDAVISDYRMPGLNGREFYERLSSQDPALARRIIFLTGDPLNDEVQSFLSSAGIRCLAKPFRLAAIEEMLDATLGDTAPATAETAAN
jgi:two-component system NtrC family sensor kinase